MANRTARVYLARMIGAFKDILPHGRGIVYRSGGEKQWKIVGWLGRPIPGQLPKLTQPSDPGEASG
jgi:hypothetical protein